MAQLSDKCATLEARLTELQRRFDALQNQEIELLERYADAIASGSEPRQREAQCALFALVSDARRDEMARRAAQQQERVAKLHAYCGSSSVSVERDDKKQLR